MIAITVDCEQWNAEKIRGKKDFEEGNTEFSFKGNENLLRILNKHNISATFFTTGYFAEHEKEQIRKINENHEVASHGYHHYYRNNENLNLEADIKKSKQAIEKVIGEKVIGFRAPQMQFSKELIKILNDLGFKYDSSIHSAHIPFVYGKKGLPQRSFKIGNIIEFPASSSYRFRFPFSWIVIRNFPLWFIISIVKNLLRQNIEVVIYMHSWEFYPVKKNIGPLYAKYLYSRHTGMKFCKKLDKFIKYFKDKGERFVMMKELI